MAEVLVVRLQVRADNCCPALHDRAGRRGEGGGVGGQDEASSSSSEGVAAVLLSCWKIKILISRTECSGGQWNRAW